MFEIKCIIIEDEPLAVKMLSNYIARVPFLKLQETFKNAVLAIEYFRKNTPDLIFLDIHLPKLKGMTFLKMLKHPPAVIVTTAYHQYAVEGFDLNVSDYLLKPFDFERFLVAVNKVKSLGVQFSGMVEIGEKKDSIFLNVKKKKVKISFAEVLYVESQQEYIKIVTTKKEYVSKMSTRDMENILPSSRFKRIHRSYIVCIDRIESYTAETVEINGVTIPVGRSYRHIIENL